MTQQMTMKHICKSARKALMAGTLQAQNARKIKACRGGCRYITKGTTKEYNCVIGSALNKNTKKRLQTETYSHLNYDDVSGLVFEGLVAFPSNEEKWDAQALQDEHDGWASCDPEFAAVNKTKFMDKLKLFEEKYGAK